MRPASASQLTPNRQSTIAVLDAGGYASPGWTRATLSMLTLPESDAVRVSVNVWCPAPSWTPAGTRSQVSQFAVMRQAHLLRGSAVHGEGQGTGLGLAVTAAGVGVPKVELVGARTLDIDVSGQ